MMVEKRVMLILLCLIFSSAYGMEEGKKGSFSSKKLLDIYYGNRHKSKLCKKDSNPSCNFPMQKSKSAIEKAKTDPERAEAFWQYIYRDSQRLFDEKTPKEKQGYVNDLVNSSEEGWPVYSWTKAQGEVLFLQFLSVACIVYQQSDKCSYGKEVLKKKYSTVNVAKIFASMDNFMCGAIGRNFYPQWSLVQKYSERIELGSNEVASPFDVEGISLEHALQYAKEEIL